MDTPEHMTVDEYSRHRGVTSSAVRQWLSAGRIQAVDPAAKPRLIDRVAADAVLDAQPEPALLPLFEAQVESVAEGILLELPSAPKRLEDTPLTEDGRPMLTVAEYAASRRERGLPGGTVPTVHEAIKRERITAETRPHPKLGQRVLVLDPELADRQWADSSGGRAPPAASPPAAPGTGQTTPRQDLEYFKAATARLEYERLMGEVLPKARVKAEWGRIARTTREGLRAIPPRLAGRVATLLREKLRLSAQSPLPVSATELEQLVTAEIGLALQEIGQELSRGASD